MLVEISELSFNFETFFDQSLLAFSEVAPAVDTTCTDGGVGALVVTLHVIVRKPPLKPPQ